MSISNEVYLQTNKLPLIVQIDKVANAELAQVTLPSQTPLIISKANESDVNKQTQITAPTAPSKAQLRNRIVSKQDKVVMRKCFSRWRKLINRRRDMMKMIDQREKLNSFMKQLRKKGKSEVIESSKADNKMLIPMENRYNAQKTIIETQKQKLEEQNKLIEELKLGIIKEDLFRSINNIKVDLHEIFGDCTDKTKLLKIHLNLSENREKFMLNSQKAPKFVHQMEEKAVQRAQNRELILERKRIIEEHRRRLLEQALENKRVLEETEKRKHLQLMAERRKRELELEKLRQANKERFLNKVEKADCLYKRTILRHSFRKLIYNCRNNQHNQLVAVQHHESTLKQRYLYKWFDLVDDLWKLKNHIADALHSHTLLRQVFRMWHAHHFEFVRSMQVAEDLYDLRLTSNTFVNWQRQVYRIINRREKRLQIAKNHYDRNILVQYFYQWRTLPAVIQLEKAKELKKRKWREQVSRILPDYRAPDEHF